MEVQKANDDNHQKRVRYNTACITANITEPGTKFKNVPDVIGVYISKFDMFQSGKTVYHIDRVVRETGEVQDNGLQEIYVNTKIDDGGNEEMCDLVENYANERAEAAAKEATEKAAKEAAEKVAKEVAEKATDSARKLFENGVSYEIVRASISTISDEDLQKIYSQVTGNSF